MSFDILFPVPTGGRTCDDMGLPKTRRVKLYSFFNSTQPYGDAVGYTITEDGDVVGSHISSCEAWANHDLYKPLDFDALFPNGWDHEFVWIHNRDTHLGFQEALRKYDEYEQR